MKRTRKVTAMFLGVLLALSQTCVQGMAEETGTITEVTTTAGENKITIIETVKQPDGTEDIKQTVTEEFEDKTVVTEKFESTTANASMVITKTYDIDDNILESGTTIYIGISNINNDNSVKTIIPQSFIQGLKEENIKNAEISISKTAITGAKNNGQSRILVKTVFPKSVSTSFNKVTVTKESISGAVKDGRELVIKLVNKDPLKSYTVTIPKSELKKVQGSINTAVQTVKISGLASGMKSKVQSILSYNGVKEKNAYAVLTADSKKNGNVGIKITAPVLSTGIKPGSSVYVYRYNNSTGCLEEIANNKKIIPDNNIVQFKGYSGKNYIITSKKLSGKNIVTLPGN